MLAAAALVALAVPALVAAHASLISSDPADGATITTPYTLTATFNEAIDPDASTLFVESAAGGRVATGKVDPDDGTRMSADLMDLPAGDYTVRWTAVTANDGGVERGSYRFTVAAAIATPRETLTPSMPEIVPNPRNDDLILAVVMATIALGAVIWFVRGRR